MTASGSPKPPNVLWICTDQQRWDTIGALGNRHINTPNIDRLVAQGTACTNAYCQSPICTPSRASFLTGCYPSTVHGCSNGNEYWAEAAPLVTKLLADAGYCCGLAGKLHLAGTAGRIEPRPRDDGYTVFHWSHDPRDQWPEGHAYRDWVAARGKHLGRTYAELGYHPAELHQTTFCADQAIAFMEFDWHQPWLMSVNIFDPHSPFDPPPDYLERYDPASLPSPAYRPSDLAAQEKLTGVDFQTRAQDPTAFDAQHKIAAYYAMIELIDHNVGCMLAALERTGQADNTLVIFTSDHGEMLGDHGLLLKGCRFYEGLVHVPLILRWPGRITAGATTDALVELTDLAPTLLDAAGSEVPRHMAGRSLLPLLRGDTTEHRDTVRCEYYEALSMAPGDRTGWSNSRATMIRNRRYKLAVYHGHPIGELFDLENDPHEHDNLWDSARHADIRFDLLRRCFDATAFDIDTGPGGNPRTLARIVPGLLLAGGVDFSTKFPSASVFDVTRQYSVSIMASSPCPAKAGDATPGGYLHDQDIEKDGARGRPRCTLYAALRVSTDHGAAGRRLEGSDLSYENLQGADLSGKNLKDATLTSTRLHRAHLMNLPGAELDWAVLYGANLDGANLAEANLDDAYLSGASLQGANLTGASFEDAYLHGADLRDANLEDVNFEGASLSGANLQGAILNGASFEDAYLYGARLDAASLAGAKLKGANLTGASLSGAILTGADLEETSLYGADLEGANLEGANLESASLDGANLRGANLKDVNLEDADLEGVDLEDANLEGANVEDIRNCDITRRIPGC